MAEIEEICRNCRFCHVDERPEKKVYREEMKGFLWWKKPEKTLIRHLLACDNSQCCRFPKTEDVQAEWWCGEFQQRPASPSVLGKQEGEG